MWTLIKDKTQYNAAMDRIIELADSELVENTPEFEEFELLSLLIKHYEDKKYPKVKTDPVRAIKFVMEQNNLSQKDMIKYLGSSSKVSEVLNYKRKLTLSMIRKSLPVPFIFQNFILRLFLLLFPLIVKA